MDHLEIGKMGEDGAALYLSNHGYLVIQRNFRCKMGEIDIIAIKDGCTVFCEVKTRKSSTFGTPAEFVDFRKQNKIKKTAVFFLGSMDADMRFDVIEVFHDGQGITDIHHIENAFGRDF